MKKISILFLFIVISKILMAVETVFTSSIFVDSNVASYSPTIASHNTNVPRRIIFDNQIQSLPGLESAIYEAEAIFSKAMLQRNIDMVNMRVELLWGEVTQFIDTAEVCKVDIEYTDDIGYNPACPHIGGISSTIPLLYPKALSYQSYHAHNGKIMTIRLNPMIADICHYDITACPADKYDMTTILLRALVMGCGMQSTMTHTNVISGGIEINQQTYISAYDALIYNNLGYKFEDILLGTIAGNNFLSGHAVFASTSDGNIELFNDAKYTSASITDKTLNTLTYEGYTDTEIDTGYIDLMDEFFEKGVSIREVTHYSMSILKELGWQWDFITGPSSNECENLYTSTITCQNSSILLPNQTYYVSVDKNNVQVNSVICQIDAIDTMYNIASSNSASFSYSSIPENVQWRRNPVSKNIVGHIRSQVQMLCGGINSMEKVCDIEIPWHPDKPVVTVNETAQGNNVILSLKAFANGSQIYHVTYTGLTNNDVHTFTVSANSIDTVLSITGGQWYNMSIYGTNASGDGPSYNLTFGGSVQPPYTLTTTVSNNTTLRYYLNGTGSENAVISLVQISNVNGVVLSTPNASPGTAIDISSLPRGYMILTVVADGITYSRIFLKRL